MGLPNRTPRKKQPSKILPSLGLQATVEGVLFEAVPPLGLPGSCRGCAAVDDEDLCESLAHHFCRGPMPKSHTHYIWIKKENDAVTPQPAEDLFTCGLPLTDGHGQEVTILTTTRDHPTQPVVALVRDGVTGQQLIRAFTREGYTEPGAHKSTGNLRIKKDLRQHTTCVAVPGVDLGLDKDNTGVMHALLLRVTVDHVSGKVVSVEFAK